MSTVLEQFQDVIRALDANPDAQIDPDALVAELSAIIPEGYQLSLEEEAERLGLSFADRFTKSDDGNYFGPRVSMRNADGSGYESPSLQEVQPEMIDYWTKRSAQVQHPYLVARYAGLAWDLAALFPERKTDHQLRKRFVQASIDLVAHGLVQQGAVAVRWLGRALEIASKFNDQELFESIKSHILHLERQLAGLEKPGVWGFAYDLLVNSKRIQLDEAEVEEVVSRLEEKLNRYAQPDADGKTDPWATEAAASRLAEFYKKKARNEEVKRVVLTVGQAYEPHFATSTAMQVSGWMQKLHQLYSFHHLNEEADAILRRLREVSAQAAEEMGGFAHKFELPKEETDAFIQSFFDGADGVGPLEQIAGRFIPNKDEARQVLYNLARQAPMRFMMPTQLTDQKGRLIASVGALEQDEDGHILLRITEHLQFQSFLLHLVLEKGLELGAVTQRTLMEFISQSTVIHPNRIPFLDRALNYYFSADFIGFVHTAVPQIEEAVRNLVEFNGGKVLRYKDGKYMLKTFDDVLRDEAFAAACGENIQLYFRIVFTDPRGLNLRNEICHGLLEYELIDKQTADRILHTLLILGLIRMVPKAAANASN